MNIEDMAFHRMLCIARIAGSLEAGDRANSVGANAFPGATATPAMYAERATEIYDAVENAEMARIDAKYDLIDAQDR